MVQRMTFCYLVSWYPCICVILLLELIYIIQVYNISSFQISLLHIESGKHGIALIPEYIPTHLNVEADYLVWKVDSRIACFTPCSLSGISTLGLTGSGYVGILKYQSRLALLHLGKANTYLNFGVE